MQQNQPSKRIVLVIEGPVPSFKTGKRGTFSGSKSGKQFARTVTRRDHRKRMQEIIRDIELQLEERWLAEAVIQTGSYPRSLTALCMPENDSVKWIKSLHVEIEKGAEDRLEIEIERV